MASGGFAVYSDTQLRAMRVVDLKQYLSMLNLKTSGTKLELVARVLAFYDHNNVEVRKATPAQTSSPPLSSIVQVQQEIDRLELEVTKIELELEVSRLQKGL
jgi:hypothetical protein